MINKMIIEDFEGNEYLPKTTADNVFLNDRKEISCNLILDATASVVVGGYLLELHHAPNTLPNIFTIRFKAVKNFVEGEVFKIGLNSFTPKIVNGADLSRDLIQTGSIVNLDFDLASHTCFFRGGGGKPENYYKNMKIFTANGNFTVPITGKYRVTVIGRGQDGNDSIGTGYPSPTGSAGGCAISDLPLTINTVIPITVSTNASFGSYLSATGLLTMTGYEAAIPAPGTGIGGNIANYTGEKGRSVNNQLAEIGGKIGGSKFKQDFPSESLSIADMGNTLALARTGFVNSRGLYAFGQGGYNNYGAYNVMKALSKGGMAAVIIEWD